jgi:hypothetical protein
VVDSIAFGYHRELLAPDKWIIKEINENKTLDSFTGTLYRLGLNVSCDSLRGGNHSAVLSRLVTLFDLRRDPVFGGACAPAKLSTKSRRHRWDPIVGWRNGLVALRKNRSIGVAAQIAITVLLVFRSFRAEGQSPTVIIGVIGFSGVFILIGPATSGSKQPLKHWRDPCLSHPACHWVRSTPKVRICPNPR